MENKIYIGLLLLLSGFGAKAQYVIKDNAEWVSLKSVPMEKAYVDHNGPLLFAGEYLYYAFYAFNAQNNNPTNVSRVGYVVLVNEAKEKVFEHKLKLNQGLAQGDFFVGTAIPSGKYKLLAYTQWMKNSGLDQVYKEDLIIINPYLADQSALLSQPEDVTSEQSSQEDWGSAAMALDSATVSLWLDGATYGPREKVRLTVSNYKGRLGMGTYTLKVRKKEALPVKAFTNATQYARAFFNADKELRQGVGDSVFLPEQRGELFFGSVHDKATKNPIVDVPVIISIPGKEFILKFALTDKEGHFYTYIRKDYKNPVAIVQLEEDGPGYAIKRGVVKDLELSGLEFSDFALSPAYASYIKERSVQNQLENQFFSKKPDSVLQGNPIDPFDGALPEVLYLDDYTRFPTFGETLVEIVKFAGYRSGGKKPDYVKIGQDFEKYNEEYNNFPAIVLIDGVFIPNHEDIKTFDARKIEKISLIRDQYVLAGKQYQGMMAIETFDGDYLETHDRRNALQEVLDLPLAKKNYFRQDHDHADDTDTRIPDYRRLLFWEPHLKVEGSSYRYDFFTSDVEGVFEVVLNGFTTYGKPITAIKEFTVMKTSQ